MTKQKIGHILFWVGAFCILAFFILLWAGNAVHKANTSAELKGDFII